MRPQDLRTTLAGPAEAVLVVDLPPALNHETADALRGCVEAYLPHHDEAGLVLDASGVEMISSVGVAVLLQVQDIAAQREALMCLAGLAESQCAFLRMLSLGERFTTRGTLEEAIAHVARSG